MQSCCNFDALCLNFSPPQDAEGYVVGVTVRRKEFYTELLLHRNEELRKVKFSFWFVS